VACRNTAAKGGLLRCRVATWLSTFAASRNWLCNTHLNHASSRANKTITSSNGRRVWKEDMGIVSQVGTDGESRCDVLWPIDAPVDGALIGCSVGSRRLLYYCYKYRDHLPSRPTSSIRLRLRTTNKRVQIRMAVSWYCVRCASFALVAHDPFLNHFTFVRSCNIVPTSVWLRHCCNTLRFRVWCRRMVYRSAGSIAGSCPMLHYPTPANVP
jgi:hypothetical protein